MSGRGRGKYWSASLLKRRGWTNALIDELLPKPRYLPVNGYNLRVWDKEDVYAAEESPQFSEGRVKGRGGRTRGPSPECGRVRDELAQAWDAAQRGGSAAWILASHYHRALAPPRPGPG